jgi:dolichyl-phosphate-mannose-protein mannosyltransferase
MPQQLVTNLPDPSRTSLTEGRRRPAIARHPLFIALIFGLAALALLVPGLGHPKSTFFDELYFVPEARALIQGTPNPTPYVSSLAKPPLGKIIIALGMKLAGDDAFGWRIAGAVCGAFTVSAVYVWTYLLLRDLGLAALAAALALVNNFLFVMSRIATVDVFLLFFLTWSLAAFTAALTLDLSCISRRLFFCASGALVGMAGAVKWNAIDTLAAYYLVVISLLYLGRRRTGHSAHPLSTYVRHLRQVGPAYLFAGLLVAPLLCYGLAFWPICRLLHLPFTPHEIASINSYMWNFNKATQVNPFITMPWYAWPFNLRPQRSLSYLVGNPVVTWGGLAALGLCLWRFCRKMSLPEGLVILLYAANLGQWIVTPQKGLYYYYYYPCVIFLGVAIAVALHALKFRIAGTRPGVLLILAAAIVFARCYGQMAHLEAPWDCLLGCFPFT